MPRVATGSDIKEVTVPAYGEYPPSYQNGDEWFMTPDDYVGVDNKMTSKIKFAKERGESIFMDSDDNADSYLEVDMPPMRYTHYIINT